MIRYKVLARRNKKEPWTSWTVVDDYSRAEQHAVHVEELGYTPKIIEIDEWGQFYEGN